tara:strand:+ start:2021 stop:2416 length:396 start_codon:yes stop_codon:yes gene_type:complete
MNYINIETLEIAPYEFDSPGIIIQRVDKHMYKGDIPSVSKYLDTVKELLNPVHCLMSSEECNNTEILVYIRDVLKPYSINKGDMYFTFNTPVGVLILAHDSGYLEVRANSIEVFKRMSEMYLSNKMYENKS